MIPDVVVSVKERTDVAEARRRAAEFAALDDGYAGALNIIVTEAATNLIKHAGGGDLIVHRTGAAGSAVEVLAVDHGPGISNIGRSFEDGYSTAGSPGTGLGAISRVASFWDAYSGPEKGFVLMARIGPALNAAHASLDIGAVCSAYPGEAVSGDCWAVEADDFSCRAAVGDGLGHGLAAAAAAHAAMESVMNDRRVGPAEALAAAHLRLRPTRGAAMSIADVNLENGMVSFAGIGNVAGAIVGYGGTRRQMISMNGTLGHQVNGTRQYQYPGTANDLVIIHSDGLSANWSFDKYPGLMARHPAVIAATLFRDFRRSRDDATIVVFRLRNAAR